MTVSRIHFVPVVIQNWPYPWGNWIASVSVVAFVVLTFMIYHINKRSTGFQELQTQVQKLQAELTNRQTMETRYRYLREKSRYVVLVAAWLTAYSEQITELLRNLNGWNLPVIDSAVTDLIIPSVPQVAEWLDEYVTGDVIRKLTVVNNRIAEAKSQVANGALRRTSQVDDTIQETLDTLKKTLTSTLDPLTELIQILNDIAKQLESNIKGKFD